MEFVKRSIYSVLYNGIFVFVYKFPVQLTYSLWRNVITMLRDYVTKVNRFIELGLPEVYVALSVREYY